MKKWRWACIAALLLGVLVLHHEVLLGGRVYHSEDAADGYYPSHVAILRALRNGELPTWERGAWAGWPVAVDPYYGLFYPLSVLYALFGAVRGLGVTVALHALGAGLGMLWLLRRRRLDWGPALFGAVSLAFGSFMVERIRHVIFMQVMAWLPLVLVGVEGYLAERRGRWLVLAAAATGMAMVCGALPLLPYVMVLLGGYVLGRLAHETPATRARSFAWLGVAAAVGALVAAAQIVPTVAHLPYSPRSLGVDYDFASTYAWPDWRYLGVLLAPDQLGGEERGQWMGAFNHWEMAGWYAGALTVLLAPLGLLRRRGELWALGAAALLAIGLAFGDHAPVHRFFFHYVPLYGALRCPTRALIMFLFAAPVLGAEGLAWLTSRPAPARGRRVLLVVGALVVVATVALALALHPHRPTPALLAAHAAWSHFALVAAAGVVIGLLALGGVLRPSTATLALALLSLVDLVTISRGYLQPHPADWAAGTERFTAVDWLFAQHPRDRFVTDWRGPFRLHNLGMTYAEEGAGGYESFGIWRYYNLLYTINHGRPYPWAKLREDLAAGDVRRFDTPLVDLLNLRWFIGMNSPGPHWVERFRPPPGAPPHAVHEPAWDPQLNVYENTQVLPRAFVVHHATVADDAQAARALTTLDPRRDALVAEVPSPAPSGSGLEPAEVTVAERHRVVVTVATPTPGLLVLADAWYPGWRVTVDSQPAPLLRADYAFRGVALPAGRHTVEFRFSSRPVSWGLVLSLLGLLGLGALAWVGRRRPSLL